MRGPALAETSYSSAGWSAERRRWTVAVSALPALALAILAGVKLDRLFTQTDSGWYLAMAAGKPAMLPFASRQLAPMIVRGLTHLPHISIERGFVIEGIAALAVFLVTILWLLVRSGAPAFMVPAVAGMVFWALQFNGLVMPDLLYAALMCVLLLLLRKGHLLGAAAMMFPMTLSRESTLLTLVCFLAAGWRRLRAREAVAAVFCTLAGLLVVKRLAAGSLANSENISPALYLVAKMPWNFARNVLGANVWANLYPACGTPQWQIALHLGRLQAVGSCGFVAEMPYETLCYALVSFGLLPLLLWRLRKMRGGTDGGSAMLLRFTLIYGGLSFVMTPLLGESLPRLYGYSWPLWLVALPLLLGASGARFVSAGWAWAFVGLHLAVSWSIWWIFFGRILNLLEATLVLWFAGWWVLRQGFESGAANNGATGIAS